MVSHDIILLNFTYIFEESNKYIINERIIYFIRIDLLVCQLTRVI